MADQSNNPPGYQPGANPQGQQAQGQGQGQQDWYPPSQAPQYGQPGASGSYAPPPPVSTPPQPQQGYQQYTQQGQYGQQPPPGYTPPPLYSQNAYPSYQTNWVAQRGFNPWMIGCGTVLLVFGVLLGVFFALIGILNLGAENYTAQDLQDLHLGSVILVGLVVVLMILPGILLLVFGRRRANR